MTDRQNVQIGIVLPDVKAAVKSYQSLIGIHRWHFNEVDTLDGKGRNFFQSGKYIEVKALIAWSRLGDIEIELIEPLDKSSIYAQYLLEKGPGVHHLMFSTNNLINDIKFFENRGISKLISGELQQTNFILFDTITSLGIITELAEGDILEPEYSLENK